MTTYAQKVEFGQRFRALVIGLDGTKGVQFFESVFQQNTAPNLKSIADQGQYASCTSIDDSHCAKTHMGPRFNPSFEWITSSGWAAVTTGVNTNKHLVKDNEFDSQSVFYQTSHLYPTFFQYLKRQGYITAAGGVGNFLSSINGNDNHVSTGIIDFECGIDKDKKTSSVPANAENSCNLDYRRSFDGDSPDRDKKLTQWLLTLINSNGTKSPDVIMGVYDTIDGAGHHYGFSSNPGYLNAIATVDGEVGQLIDAIKSRVANNHESWLVLITSDHGGHVNADGGGGHDKVKLDDEVVPFVVGVFSNSLTLTNHGPFNATDVNQMDVSPSVLNWFNMHSATDGTVRSQYQWTNK